MPANENKNRVQGTLLQVHDKQDTLLQHRGIALCGKGGFQSKIVFIS